MEARKKEVQNNRKNYLNRKEKAVQRRAQHKIHMNDDDLKKPPSSIIKQSSYNFLLPVGGLLEYGHCAALHEIHPVSWVTLHKGHSIQHCALPAFSLMWPLYVDVNCNASSKSDVYIKK